MKIRTSKQGMFFTIDSLLASGIIIIALILISSFYIIERRAINVNFASQDLVKFFSTMKVKDIDNDYVKSLIASGEITNVNNTILDQIGDFWANNNIELARNLTRNLTNSTIPSGYGFSILINGEEIYSRDAPITRLLISSRKIISGIAKAKPTQGFTARVLLNGIKSKKTNAYAYFGGYEGEGNLTKKLILPKDVISFNSSYIEVDTGGNFNLYINGIFSGSYAQGSGGGGILADKWNISNNYLSNFKSGENTVNINFTSGANYIAGGFLKVTYVTSSYNDTQTPGTERDYLPGIDGIINLYSSVYIPEALNNMNIFLNFSSNYTTYLRLGNTTIYENNTNGTKTQIQLTNSTLKTLLDYNSFNQKTIPLRLGITNATTLGGGADAMLVSDVSGSMEWCSASTGWSLSPWTKDGGSGKGCRRSSNKWYWFWGNSISDSGYFEHSRKTWSTGGSTYCGCRYNSAACAVGDNTKINKYKDSAKSFADILYNISGNKMGLVDFSSSSGVPGVYVYQNSCTSSSTQVTDLFTDGIIRFQDITEDVNLIKNAIDTTEDWWNTCTCCGINKAVNILNSQSSAQKRRYIILMSDGAATDLCAQQSNGTAIADAVQSASDACNQGISVYSIAFGADADTATMQRMNCSGGKFYNAVDTTKLQQAYNEIAGYINQLSYSEQTVNLTGGIQKSAFYPSSYVEFNYSVPDTQFNKIPLSFETERFGNNISAGNLTIYENTSVLDAKVTSYSGSKWTDNLVVNGNNVYRLGDFGNNYQILGDPFAVNIPIGNLNQGANSITISTGLNSTFSTNGSSDDKVIYTLLLNSFVDYSSVVAKSNGCSWTVNFEDGSTATIKVPSSYSGTDACSFSLKTYDSNDALDNVVYQLFNNLDIDKNGKLDVNIDANNLNVNTLTISKVPSLWGPAIIEIRVWE